MDEAKELDELIKQLSDRDERMRIQAAKALGNLGVKAVVPSLIKSLSDTDRDVQQAAAKAPGKLGYGSAVPALITALSDSEGMVRRYAAEALGKLGDKSAVPHLIKAVGASSTYARRYASEALVKLGVKEPAKPKLNFFPNNWPRSGEFHRQPVEVANNGSGPAFDLRLSLSGPAVGNEVSLQFATLPPREKVAETITIRPEAPGSAVPLHWELTYNDVNGPNQKLQGSLYIEVASRTTQPSVNIGTIVQGSVDGVVVGKVGSQKDKPFAACPYCGEALNLPKTPRFCPFCKEKLVEN